MLLVGTLEQLNLSDILQRIEIKKETGLLTITQGEQRLELYLKQGELTYIGPLQGRAPLQERLLKAGVISRHELIKALLAMSTKHSEVTTTGNRSEIQEAMALTELGLVSRERLDAFVIQEATELIQDLLTWSAGEVHFEEKVQPPMDRLPFCLRITSMIPSLLGTVSPSILPIRDPKPITDGPSIPASPFPAIFDTPRLVVEEIQLPITSLPAVFDTPTMVQKSVMPSRTANIILPLSNDDLTTKLPTARKNRNYFLRWEVLLIVAILLIVALAHGINMFHFPYFEDDEGTYMSQAWAVVHEGRLAYYTYWYDHAPAGWLLIAAWTMVTGGFHTFGSAINSGRVLMLLMQVGSTFILYRIARRISSSVTVAVIVSLLFALSPYGIYFHRRVLLDNITTFWMLLSILLLVSGRLSLKRVWLSAVALGLSMLSKEVTVFLVPVMTYLVFFRADKSHRWFATIGWIALVSCLVSLYPLMAILKGELFPTGTLLGGTAPHVSLLGTVQFQASRGKDGGLLDLHSGFWILTRTWAQDDPMLVVVGSICAILSVLTMKKQRLVGVMGAVTLSLWVFLGRGGEVIGFYLVPLLPLLALNVGLVLGLAFNWLKTFLTGSTGIAVARTIQIITLGMCLFGILVGYTTSPDLGFKSNRYLLWNVTQTDAQNQATQWIEKNLPLDSRMIIDEYMWTDLYDSGYTFAHYYWKVQEDPAIRDKVFHNDWRNVDYIITTPQLLGDAQNTNMTLVEEALMHSTLIVHFDSGGGWPIEIRKVNK